MTTHHLDDAAARAAVTEAVRRVVPDAVMPADDVPLRRDLELDSLDFLAFVEHLARITGVPIAEADYPALATMSSCVAFLGARHEP
ncbi:acyl carrier protein [Nocardioides guangzhouensis]|uniref:Acyl carrier protein n=1 Tax=Nocardioides guangzhouensis TaxID=2497878 RepID=A0A4Q4Z4T1_9ACTN|nr:phosphopantetheine-binding protein [Nocardioides guangzhouensis]RYP82683.1 acyl carrier protein [Nocardioides guangzhouensis]